MLTVVVDSQPKHLNPTFPVELLNLVFHLLLIRGDVLLAVRYDGQLSCYHISEQLTLLHSFSLCQHHPGGVGAVLYHSTLRILVVAGWGGREGVCVFVCLCVCVW